MVAGALRFVRRESKVKLLFGKPEKEDRGVTGGRIILEGAAIPLLILFELLKILLELLLRELRVAERVGVVRVGVVVVWG